MKIICILLFLQGVYPMQMHPIGQYNALKKTRFSQNQQQIPKCENNAFLKQIQKGLNFHYLLSKLLKRCVKKLLIKVPPFPTKEQ